jgi:protein-tyrosine-phosphatase
MMQDTTRIKLNEGRPTRVLFLCTHNSARSQLAEAIMRHMGGPGVEAFSAGTEPSQVRAEALSTLAEMGISSEGLRSKHVNELLDQDFDYVITVCDNARETCPVFPRKTLRLHWSLPDPSAVQDPGERRQAFRDIASGLQERIGTLLGLQEREPA